MRGRCGSARSPPGTTPRSRSALACWLSSTPRGGCPRRCGSSRTSGAAGLVLARDGEIRLSARLRNVPDWSSTPCWSTSCPAHLHHVDHSSSFHSMAERHPRQSDAELFLDGYQLGLGIAEEERAPGID